ncbi:MAG: hypothetical protein QNJ51_01550 [Calothrix sp. MO_167.B12]|nr:hypothetical protein [Calothrix sp. MO_167.B12]
MSYQIKSKNPELFTEVSEYEQEAAAGGLSVSLFQQETEILSFANSQTSASRGDINISSSQTSLYSLSQKTTGIVFNLGNYYSSPGPKVPALQLLRRMFLYFLSR